MLRVEYWITSWLLRAQSAGIWRNGDALGAAVGSDFCSPDCQQSLAESAMGQSQRGASVALRDGADFVQTLSRITLKIMGTDADPTQIYWSNFKKALPWSQSTKIVHKKNR